MIYRTLLFFLLLSVGLVYSGDLDLFLDDASLLRAQQANMTNYESTAPDMQEQPRLQLQSKSKGKAFLLSLILPGMGEKYVGANSKATMFLATEVTLWLGYTGFVTYRDWRKEDYKTYAASHAQVELEGKSDSYFIDVGNYSSIYEYNAAKLRQRNLPEYYRDEQAYFWQWQSEAHRQKFDQLRIASDKANNRSMFVIGAILANHVLSAIDAVWSAHKASQQQPAIGMDVRVGDGWYQPMVNVGLTARF